MSNFTNATNPAPATAGGYGAQLMSLESSLEWLAGTVSQLSSCFRVVPSSGVFEQERTRRP